MAVEIAPGAVVPFKAITNKYAAIPGRPNTRTECFVINFELAGGGMGDYICWLPSLLWTAKNCPWVHGRVFAPAYFIEVVRHVFDGIANWEVLLIEKHKELAEQGTLQRGLMSAPNQLLNATGANLVRQGFAMFPNMDFIPDGTTYPILSVGDKVLPKPLRQLGGRYVVLTPGGTTKARFIKAAYWNLLIEFLISKQIMPVFLGKTQLADVHRSYFDDEVHYDKGVDLREKTTLLEAAKVMQDAICTVGLDNGLLHLACCTNANVVFAYNIASPRDRRPIMHAGKLIELVLSKEEMPCIHCQSDLKLLYTHNFKNCIYNDTACIDKLFDRDGLRFKNAIEFFINDKTKGAT